MTQDCTKLFHVAHAAPPTRGGVFGRKLGMVCWCQLAPICKISQRVHASAVSVGQLMTFAHGLGFCNYVELIDPTFRDAGGVD